MKCFFILTVDKDHCETAVKFTKCIYAHKNEVWYIFLLLKHGI